MRVLVCHPEFWFGGAESVVFDAIQAFNGRNYSVYLVTGHCDSYWLDKLKNSVTEMLYGSVTMCGDWFHGMHFLAFRAWLKWGQSCVTVLRIIHNVNRCFPWISNRICSVHYPAIPIVTTQCSDAAKFEYCKTLPTNYFLSLNRYWPEKRVDIAIEAFMNAEDKVIFLQNVSSEEKVQLLSRCTGVIYTPPMEHFGITPLEGTTGCGTNETVENGKTGILVDFGAENFSDAMAKMIVYFLLEPRSSPKDGTCVISGYSPDTMCENRNHQNEED
ncbi:alpha-1,3-mannosyltransferase ALG2 [Trichinella spiralis]|uniref:alpha-1,3-mannosyltransferase ALG2 n=1 Tax=Trichinella spiralis TaxID=6334 RepID=UPI0001EFD026|nr:alpha-1,3-mannosyltransferase ALG2 [Trichinella spiralis]